jgi:hypothetical protein
MNKLIQIINEEISAIRKDKKQEIFDDDNRSKPSEPKDSAE